MDFHLACYITNVVTRYVGRGEWILPTTELEWIMRNIQLDFFSVDFTMSCGMKIRHYIRDWSQFYLKFQCTRAKIDHIYYYRKLSKELRTANNNSITVLCDRIPRTLLISFKNWQCYDGIIENVVVVVAIVVVVIMLLSNDNLFQEREREDASNKNVKKQKCLRVEFDPEQKDVLI